MPDESQTSDLAILDSVARVPEHVVYRSFEAETLLLNLETGHYHGVNQTGGRLLEIVKDGDGALRPAVEQLAREYDIAYEEIAPDLAAFCQELADRDLVVLDRA